LGDHGYSNHGYALYDESVGIVLGVELPGSRSNATTVDEAVSIRSLAPVLAAIVEDPATVDMAGALPPSGRGADIVHFSAGDKIGGVRDGWKAIFDESTGVRELYDVDEDPDEMRNLADEFPDIQADIICAAKEAR